MLECCGAVVVAHARTDLAARCVRSLQRWLPPARIVVVLNDPVAAGPGAAEALAGDAVVVSPPSPQGYGANLNLGAASLGSEVAWLALSNDDVVFQPRCLNRLVETLARDDAVGLVGPAIRGPNGGRPAEPHERFPTLTPGFGSGLLPSPLSHALLRGLERHSDASGGVPWLVGCAMVARRSAFDAVGGFDEDFVLYFEEIDLCRRLTEAGWRIVWRGDAEVVHEQGASIPPVWTTSAMGSARRLFFKKRVGLFRWTLIEVRLVMFFAASVLYACLASVFKPRTAGLRIWRLRYAWDNRVFVRSTRPKLHGTTR